MNYDEYIEEVQKYSSDEVVARLVSHLSAWKFDDTDVLELANSVEKFFGSSWIFEEKTHNHLYHLWANFKATAISGIGGMTINERLYLFGLFERFESVSEAGKQNVYAKLRANT
jgi:hypothetical protein